MLDVLWRSEAFRNPSLFLITLSWLLFHVLMLISVAKLLKAPFFFVAVGSMANIGGAVTAPIVASAFDPALAPVGVLLAVLGYALGTCKALPPPAPTSPTSATCRYMLSGGAQNAVGGRLCMAERAADVLEQRR